MKRIVFLSVFIGVMFCGCSSKTELHKSNIPSGRWVAINPDSYVPPNTDIYFKTNSFDGGSINPNTVDVNSVDAVVIQNTRTVIKGAR